MNLSKKITESDLKRIKNKAFRDGLDYSRIIYSLNEPIIGFLDYLTKLKRLKRKNRKKADSLINEMAEALNCDGKRFEEEAERIEKRGYKIDSRLKKCARTLGMQAYWQIHESFCMELAYDRQGKPIHEKQGGQK